MPLNDLKEESSLVSHDAKHYRSTSTILKRNRTNAYAIALGVELDSKLSEKSEHSFDHLTLYEILFQ